MENLQQKPHIALIAGGTRGDVQPCLALGKGLQQVGYTVTIVAGSNFGAWITEQGLGFADLGVDIEAMMNSDEGKAWVDSNPLTELQRMKEAFEMLSDALITRLMTQLRDYDVIVTGLTMFPIAAPIAQAAGIPLLNLLFAPIYPTKAGEANLIAVRPQAHSRLNLLTRPMMFGGLWYAGGSAAQTVCEELSIPRMGYSDFVAAWKATPTLIAVSPQVVPPPPDYPDHVRVTGFLFLEQGDDWQAPPDLLDFLAAGAPPVYIGFGSMTGHEGDGTLSLLVEALDGRRGIINRGWSQMQAATVPDNVYLLDGAPHDWLFPRMAALVHHGGAGTTAAGLRAGVPTIVIPHIADQPYYGRRVHELGVGAEPLMRRKLTAPKLKAALDTLLTDDALQARARALGNRIRAEDGVTTAVAAIDDFLMR